MSDEQAGTPPTEEPKGSRSSRGYQILSHAGEGPEADRLWTDHGEFAGSTQESAILAARRDQAPLRERLADGGVIVAVPVAYWRKLKLTVEVVERESFEPVDGQ